MNLVDYIQESAVNGGIAVILTFDLGNANIVMCCVEDGRRLCRFVLSADKARTADEYSVVMALLAKNNGIDLSEAHGSIIASVVPQLTGVVARAVHLCTGTYPLIVGPGVKSGLNIRMDTPTELGGDLVAAGVAAVERYPLPCIVIDMGTATAVGVIDGKGCYIGGLICPGVSLSQSGLAKSASQLPDVSLETPKKVIGKNTRDGMRSGLVYGTAAMLDGVIARVEQELGEHCSVVVTGDSAHEILPCCSRTDIILDEDLIMRGLWRIFCRNTGKA